MTTPTPTQPERMSAAEIREEFEKIHKELDILGEMIFNLSQAMTIITQGIQHAATANPPAPAVGPVETITETATHIERESRKGRTYYRVMCGRFSQHGVKIWPEYFPAVGIDPDALTWVDDRAKIDPPIRVTIEMETYTKDGETKTGPRRVIGRA